ncbi:MAG: hypothetical protein O9326_19505 [Microcystis sp. LE19-338.1B]|jgi:hypothetical protein|nr:hypothetical protein [Microcystis sp. LE19-338.1B]MCZ8358076.1 hypothetical protein [Microcystis sp. LE19-388.1G]
MADTTKQVSMLELELEDDLIRQIEDVADSGCFSKDELLQSILESWRYHQSYIHRLENMVQIINIK